MRFVLHHLCILLLCFDLALGRCTRTQHWSCAFRKERPNCMYLHAHICPFSVADICETSIFSATLVYLSLHDYMLKSQGLRGYRHEPFQHCPQGEAHKRGKCWCDRTQNFGDYEQFLDPFLNSEAFSPRLRMVFMSE